MIKYPLIPKTLFIITLIVIVVGLIAFVDWRMKNTPASGSAITIDTVTNETAEALNNPTALASILKMGTPEYLAPKSVLLRLSNGDYLLEFYDLRTSSTNFLLTQNPVLETMSNQTQKIFYFRADGARYIYLDRDVRGIGTVSNINEVRENGKMMIDFSESGRRIRSEPMLTNMFVLG
jgi:hypothetical protein